MNGPNHSSIQKTAYWLVVITVLGTFASPSLLLISGFPKIEISDLTLAPLFLITLLYKREEFLSFYRLNKGIVVSFFFVSVIATFSILLNGRISFYRDWFEVLKFIKLLCFMSFFYLYIDLSKWDSLIKAIFIIVVFLNLLHYFNVLSFNSYIEIYYAEAHHLDLFGITNSGETGSIRMLGTMGNPNNNALMFLMFLVLLLPTREEKLDWNMLYPLIAILGVLACQSRTGFIVLVVLLTFYFIIQRIKIKHILFYFVLIAAAFFLLKLAGNTYIGSLSNVRRLEAAKAGRVLQWIKIFDSMGGSWVFGHGVNKEYFEKNEIYAESEYFLILFRYGVVGVITLIGFWGLLLFRNLKNIRKQSGILFYGSFIVFALSGIMNTPLHSTKLSVVLVLSIGLGLLYKDGREKV